MPEALIFQLPQYKSDIIVADTEEVYDPVGFLSAGWSPLSRRCHNNISLIDPISRYWCQVYIANWHRHVFHLQYISSVIALSRVMSLQYRCNIRMSTGLITWLVYNLKFGKQFLITVIVTARIKEKLCY